MPTLSREDLEKKLESGTFDLEIAMGWGSLILIAFNAAVCCLIVAQIKGFLWTIAAIPFGLLVAVGIFGTQSELPIILARFFLIRIMLRPSLEENDEQFLKNVGIRPD